MDERFPKRKTMRLQGYDYSQSGAYHITICTKNREKILWKDILRFDTKDWKSNLSEFGEIVDRQINDYNGHREITVDKYVIMPDHVHLLVFVNSRNVQAAIPHANGNPAAVPCMSGCTTGEMVNDVQNKRIPHYVGTLKRFVNREIGENIWQKSYYDTIIRSREEYIRTWEYIENNPHNLDDE